MFDDLVELATTAVHPDHDPHISHPISSNNAFASSNMPPRRRREEKSQSVSSTSADVNGMPPPVVPASKSPSPVATRHRRTRSTNSQLSSPRHLAQALTTRPHQTAEKVAPLKFVAATLASLLLSILLRNAAATYTSLGSGALSAFSKNPAENSYAFALLGWRVLVLSVYWFGGYDAYDVASLTVLTTTPVALLHFLFYKIRPEILCMDAAIGVLSSTIPFLVLRSIAPAHHPGDKSTRSALRNRAILTDPYTTAFTSILATAILAVLLELSFETFLPTFLIKEFTYISTLEPAHRGAAQLPILLLALLPAGLACRFFLFAPSTSVPAVDVVELDTRTASLVDHIQWNLWGWYSSRQKVLLTRTAVLTTLVFAETFSQCTVALEGVSVVGAAGYAGFWVAGIALVTAVLDWVSTPSDY